MKRYHLTLKAGYLPGWGLYEGIRELVQNARDAEVQDGAKMKVEFVWRQRDKRPVGTILITNEGTVIPKEAFLIGHTSKDGRSDLIGKFGEGLKFGILALLRIRGIDIKIRNGDESWNPLICRSNEYDAEVLAFDVASGNKYENRVQIEVIGVQPEDWAKIQEKFLFITPPHQATVINVDGGKVLISPQHKGQIFVKGMYVCTNSSLFYGYDADEADIDRDRRMVSNPQEISSRLLTRALISGKLGDKIYDLLHEGSTETSQMWHLGEEAREQIVARFHKQYGKDAIPVEYDEQVTELGHLGVRGVMVPSTLRYILCSALGQCADNIAKLKMNARHTYQLSDLTEPEQANFTKAQEILRHALVSRNITPQMADKIFIVDFSDAKLAGTYSEGTIRLARHRLQKVSAALRTMIHEAAHRAGGDGSKQHEEAIGNLTETAFALLLSE